MDGLVLNTVITDCQEFLRLVENAEGENRKQALNALQFAAGDQWPSNIKAVRDLENRPCLTINKTDAFVRQVCNSMRQQRPRMVPHPANDGADVDTAEVIKGMIRHIEAQSNADVAYDTASDFQVRIGWGYIRVNHRYISEDSFDQEICIDPVDNPFQVYFDPFSVMPDGSDAEACAVSTMMRRTEFKKKWPGAAPVDFRSVSAGDIKPEWASEAEIRIVEFWRVETTPDKLVLMSNGWQGFKSQMPKSMVSALDLTVVNERDSMRRKVMMYRMTAKEVLEKKEWAGKYLPIIPVYGCKLNVNGRVERYGMIKNLIDPARMYNFWRTSEAEIVALAPKAPWLMAEGQDEGNEQEWESANVKSYSRLKYKAVTSEDGTPLPPPQRQQPQQIPAANVNAATGAAEDMKAVAGIYDASLGDREQDPSGIALQRHQQQSDTSNYHYYDNQCRSLRWLGIVILDLMPKIYDTQRTMRIIGEDGEPSSVTINEKQRNEAGAVTKVLNDVTVGRYDVVMDTGPGYATRRMETAENMMKLLGTPIGEKVAQLADDIVVRHMDWTGSRELADRLAAANPLAQEEQLPDFPPEAQAMIKQLRGQMQQMQQAMQTKEMEDKFRIGAVKLREEHQDRRHILSEHAENQRLAAKETAQTLREHHRDTTTAAVENAENAAWMHDVAVKSQTALDVEKIRALVQLLLKHVDGEHLERELEAAEKQVQSAPAKESV